jgi:hypothetical protein
MMVGTVACSREKGAAKPFRGTKAVEKQRAREAKTTRLELLDITEAKGACQPFLCTTIETVSDKIIHPCISKRKEKGNNEQQVSLPWHIRFPTSASNHSFLSRRGYFRTNETMMILFGVEHLDAGMESRDCRLIKLRS